MNGRTNSAGGALVSDMEIPLDPCTDFVGVRIKDLEYLGKVRLTWTDPKDKYATPEGEAMEDTDQLVSKWSYTQIVRQADRAPVNPSDGVTVCTETTRNQYQTTGFVDTTAESNVTYYYAAYAFNEDDVYSEVISNGVQPVSFSTTLADNTWEEIDQACTLGLAESLWEIGDEKTFNSIISITGSDQSVTITGVIIDFNHDNLADGTGKATITFCNKNAFYSTIPYERNWYNKNSGINQALCEIYNNADSSFKNIVKTINVITQGVYQHIAQQYIYFSDPGTNRSLPFFPFGIIETNYNIENRFGADGWDYRYENLNDGTLYPYFSIQTNRAKGESWWLRSVWASTNLLTFDKNGRENFDTLEMQGSSSYHYNSLVFGFCIGKVAV